MAAPAIAATHRVKGIRHPVRTAAPVIVVTRQVRGEAFPPDKAALHPDRAGIIRPDRGAAVRQIKAVAVRRVRVGATHPARITVPAIAAMHRDTAIPRRVKVGYRLDKEATATTNPLSPSPESLSSGE